MSLTIVRGNIVLVPWAQLLCVVEKVQQITVVLISDVWEIRADIPKYVM